MVLQGANGPDYFLEIKYSLIVFFRAGLSAFIFFSPEEVGIHLPSGKMIHKKHFRYCLCYKNDGHLKNKQINQFILVGV